MNELQEHTIQCPYCWESIAILVDCSEPFQDYIEDCQVCCRPIRFVVTVDQEDHASVTVFHEDD